MDESVTAEEAFFGITPILNEEIEYNAILDAAVTRARKVMQKLCM